MFNKFVYEIYKYVFCSMDTHCDYFEHVANQVSTLCGHVSGFFKWLM